MATSDDLISVLNNPYTNLSGASLADALSTLNAPIPKTVTENKRDLVQSKVLEKQQKLKPTNVPAWYKNPNDPNNMGLIDHINPGFRGSNLVDVAQSSVLQSTRNIKDFVFGNISDAEEVQRQADLEAGVSPQYREYDQSLYTDIAQNYADNNYGELALSLAKAGPSMLANSANIVPEMLVGTALTATGIGAAGSLGLAGKKAKGAVDIYEKFKDQVALAEKAKEANKIKENLVAAGKFTAKSVATMSPATANIVQQNRNEFYELHGEEPSAERVAADFLVTSATMMVYPQFVKKFFVPKALQNRKQGDLLDDLYNGATDMVKRAQKPFLHNMAGTLVKSTLDMAKVGGAEAAQEFAQTWASIYATRFGVDETKNLFQDAIDVATNQENIDQSILGALQGFTAGATLKGATKLPSDTVKTTFDAGTGVAKYVGKKIDQKALESLSPEEIVTARADIAARKDVYDRTKASSKATVDKLKATSSFAEVDNELLSQRLSEVAGDKDLNDPEVFNDAKAAIIRNLGSEAAQQKAAIVALEGKFQGTKYGKAALKATGITPERVTKSLKAAKDLSEKTIEALSKYKESTALGLIESAANYSAEQSRNNGKALQKSTANVSPKLIRKVAENFKESYPETAEMLIASAERKENAQARLGTKTDTVIKSENLHPAIRNLPNKGSIASEDASQVVSGIIAANKGVIEDKKTIDLLTDAITAVKDTDYVKQSGDTAALDLIANELAERKLEIRTTAEKVKDTVKEVAGDAIDILPSVKISVNKEAIDKAMAAFPDKVKAKFSKENIKKTFQSFKDSFSEDSTESVAYNPTEEQLGVIGTLGQIGQMKDLDNEKAQQVYKKFSEKYNTPEGIKEVSEELGLKDPKQLVKLLDKTIGVISEDRPKFKRMVKDALKESKPDKAVDNKAQAVKHSGKTEVELEDDGLPFIDIAIDTSKLKKFAEQIGLPICSKG